MRRASGQASADYVAVLLVVVTVLAGAATAALAVPGVGERVVSTVRTGICIVGGDLCRTSDAAAAGLPPCVTAQRSDSESTTLDVAVVRFGENGEWVLALQSDGGAVVTRLAGSEIGGTAGVGVTFSPLDIEASARAALSVGYRGGSAWRFSDAAAARAFLAAAQDGHGGRPPDVRWDALTGDSSASAGVALADLASAGVAISADGALGLRRDGARRTITLDLGSSGPAFEFKLPGFGSPAPERRTVVADVTWEGGAARELVLRSASAKGDRLEELGARLDLRDAESRAIAERVLRPGGGDADMRALMARIATHGVVERTGYSVAEDRSGISIAGRLGVALGLSHEKVESERRLVDAVAWIRGGPPQRRFDCLGV